MPQTQITSKLHTEIEYLRDVLRRIEWIRIDTPASSWWECPSCRKQKREGHVPCCHLAAALEPR